MTLPDFKGNFMPTMLPAAPGTYVIEREDDQTVIRTPVIAWAPDADNPYRKPHPIGVSGLQRLVDGRAILHPDGMVDDPSAPVTFADVDEWFAFLDAGGSAGSSPARAEAKAKPVSKPKASAPEPEAEELQIEWTTKPFKTNSFYRYETDELDFIFQIDGGVNPPKQKDPVTKIKRDEFMSLRKTVDVADVDDLMNGIYPGMVEVEEDYDEDDGDDAASSLI